MQFDRRRRASESVVLGGLLGQMAWHVGSAAPVARRVAADHRWQKAWLDVPGKTVQDVPTRALDPGGSDLLTTNAL